MRKVNSGLTCSSFLKNVFQKCDSQNQSLWTRITDQAFKKGLIYEIEKKNKDLKMGM